MDCWWESFLKLFYRILIAFSVTVPSAQAGTIALIIDDIGYSYSAGIRAARLDPAVTLSILPDAPEAEKLGQTLYDMGRELMLHLPMEARNRDAAIEPVVLNSRMERLVFQRAVLVALRRLPWVKGVNNHMGSLLTCRKEQMGWLMQVLRALDGMYFVDSRTDRRTVAEQVARRYQLDVARRDVFLDNGDFTRRTVWSELKRLEKLARNKGFALAIGHPHRVTLQVLEEAIPWLRAKGHTIVPVSQYIKAKESLPCPECLSPSLKLVKNSKRLPLSTCCGEPVLR